MIAVYFAYGSNMPSARLGERVDALLQPVREFVAQLIEDSRVGAPALALRGRGLARTHLLYRVGDYDLDLAHLSDGGLVGQVPCDSRRAGARAGHLPLDR